MDKFALMREGKAVGELQWEQETDSAVVSARCPPQGDGLWCAWAIGQRQELRIGLMEKQNGQWSIRRRFSRRLTDPLGPLVRGELRAVGQGEQKDAWKAVERPEMLFRPLWLRRQMQGMQGVKTRKGEGSRFVAIPYAKNKPFPLPALFCFARIVEMGEREYAVFAFDERDWPQF